MYSIIMYDCDLCLIHSFYVPTTTTTTTVKNKYEEELTELRTSSESTIEKLRERLDEVGW